MKSRTYGVRWLPHPVGLRPMAWIAVLVWTTACSGDDAPADGAVDLGVDVGADLRGLDLAADGPDDDGPPADSAVDTVAADSSTDAGREDATGDAAPDLTLDLARDLATDLMPDAGTPDSSPNVNVAFVTSTTVVPGSLGGLSGADAICNARAVAAKLPGSYVAWLSDSSTNAIDRLAAARGWVRTDGKALADKKSELVGGAKWHPLDRDEFGVQVSGTTLVVTATTSAGTASSNTCSDWTATTGSVSGGNAVSLIGGFSSGFNLPCDGATFKARLYCFGTDFDTSVSPAVHSGRKAFVTKGKFTPSGGIGGADTLCATEANTAGLTGTFRAFLATTTSSARSRFTGTTPWVRTDGILLGALDGRSLETGILAHADGSYPSSGSWVWTGAMQPTATGTTQTCLDWASADAGESARGGSMREPRSFFSAIVRPCNTQYPVYCLEQ